MSHDKTTDRTFNARLPDALMDILRRRALKTLDDRGGHLNINRELVQVVFEALRHELDAETRARISEQLRRP